MKRFASCKVLVFLCCLMTWTSLPVAQSAAEGITEDQATAILNELKQIRGLLERQQKVNAVPTAVQPNEKVALAVRDDHAFGSNDAKITIVEFTDYQCPFCNKFHMSTYPKLKKEFVDSGLVKFISRDLPLDFHQHAFEAARAARCAGEQNRYWEVRDWLSSHPDKLSKEAILTAVVEAGADGAVFQVCLDSDRHREAIRQDIVDANAVGITGTPGFVIGRVSNGMLEGIKIVGAQSYDTFESRIRQQLSAPGNR
jgi:protein-disulfide isomerase